MKQLLFTEPERWNHSYSSINTFANICETRYASEKTSPWQDTEDSLRGTQIHNFLEAWANHQFAEAVYHELVAEAVDPLGPEELEAWVCRVHDLATKLKPIEVETWQRLSLDGCRRKLVGKIDLVSANGPDGIDAPTLVDWKSTKSMGKKLTQYECDQSLQGRIYSMFTGVRRVAFVYFTPNHDAEFVLSEYSDKQIAETSRFVTHTCQQIEKRWRHQDWRKAHPGGLCSKRWCALWRDCYGDCESP